MQRWKYSLEFYLDEGIENFLIPKLTLQPLIENCIKHGIGQGKIKSV